MRTLKFRCFDNKSNKMIENCSHVQRDGIEIMQFTGLLDRYNVEIYEGDIVRAESEVFEVRYMCDDSYPAFEIVGWGGDDNGLSHIVIEGEAEVIGNIYENQELLENTNE